MKRDEKSLADSLLGWRAGSAWLILIAVAALGVRPGTAATMKPGAPAIAAPASEGEPANALLAAEAATIDLFDTASRSVVCIRTFSRHVEESAGAVHELPLGAGSGFVWDRQGHVVTNFHVVDGAEQVEVALADHTHWRARLVGIAPELDLAVLRIDAPAEKLEPLPVGDSSRVRVGQTVLAVGNPFGFDHTLTTGIVSALGRTVDSPSGVRIHDVIQTDAAINPGSSGGPLIDSRGRLVGVNTAIYATSGSSAGVGFAIPVAAVVRAVPQLVRHGRIVRPSLGFELAPDALAEALGLAGALVLNGRRGQRGGTARRDGHPTEGSRRVGRRGPHRGGRGPRDPFLGRAPGLARGQAGRRDRDPGPLPRRRAPHALVGPGSRGPRSRDESSDAGGDSARHRRLRTANRNQRL